MANMPAAWGIEIGNAGLKALRLRYADAASQALAVAFDYVPHPKLLSQPDAQPDELIGQALDTFLSRNQVAGDWVAISLPGKDSLAKFINLPPVDVTKLKEIIQYEARQQIPFALEDVIWDFQPMGGAVQDGGFLMDAEVGLFAMKREQVLHQMQPFNQRKVELELIQIAPLATFNFVWYDRMGFRKGATPQSNDEYVVILDMGCDNTTLIVTNGIKIWTRNVPLGGNHFTRALTKEMKLTFAKAEHLKCNATKSPDPRAVFQGMRPVFNDYVTEIQRSIGFFSSVNRNAKISRLVGVGNGFKLAGLQKYLQQNLSYDVDRVESFQALAGDQVLSAPLFQENILTFVVPYGLAIQALQQTDIHTSLLPPEITLTRKIRKKKPWAAAAAATLLAGLSMSAFGYASVLQSVGTDRFQKAEKDADEFAKYVSGLESAYKTETGAFATKVAEGERLVGPLKTRDLWFELYRSFNSCLPRDTGIELDENEIAKMNRISIKSFTAKRYDDLSKWFKEDLIKNAQGQTSYESFMDDFDKKSPPSGPGYVFDVIGLHYHDEPNNVAVGRGVNYVNATLLKNLKKWQLELKSETGVEVVDVRRLGISHPTLLYTPQPRNLQYFPQGKKRAAPSGPGAVASNLPVGAAPNDGPEPIPLVMTQFRVQFVWKPTPVADRKDEVPADLLPKPADGSAATAPTSTPAAAPGKPAK